MQLEIRNICEKFFNHINKILSENPQRKDFSYFYSSFTYKIENKTRNPYIIFVKKNFQQFKGELKNKEIIKSLSVMWNNLSTEQKNAYRIKERKENKYSLFVKENFHKVKKKYPELKIGEISRILAKLWKKINNEKEQKITKKEEEKEQKITKKEEEKEGKVSSQEIIHYSYNKEELIHNIEYLIEETKKTKQEQYLKQTKNYRNRLLQLLGVKDYILFLKKNMLEMKDILENTFQIPSIMLNKKLMLLFNTMEIRLLKLPNFYNINIEVDDLVWFKNSLQQVNLHSYDKIYLFNNILNYSLCISPILELIETNFKTFFIYVDRNTDYPYAFYFLESVRNNINNWRMDCRLEMLVTDIIDNLTHYCIELFREIYENIFGHNNYTERFLSYNNFTQTELKQLLDNIILLSDEYLLTKKVMEIFQSNPYQQTRKDKFNLKYDDILQKETFLELEKNRDSYRKNKLEENMKILFDTEVPTFTL